MEMISLIKMSVSLGTGMLVSRLFRKERAKEAKTAGYYREVLEKFLSPFYLSLLNSRIKTLDKIETKDAPQAETDKIIILREVDEKRIWGIMEKSAYLSAFDTRLTKVIRDFLSCYESDYKSKETGEKVFIIFQETEVLFNEYSEKYKSVLIPRKKTLFLPRLKSVKNKSFR